MRTAKPSRSSRPRSCCSSFVKWAAVIRQTERIPEYVSHAFHMARSGRPGPVVLGLPEDMLAAECEAVDAKRANIAVAHPGAADMAALQAALAKAARPLMIVGGPGWSTSIKASVEAFAERFDLPVASAFRYQDYVDNRHRCYVGCVGIGIEPKLAQAVKTADLLIVVGARLGEMTSSGYTLLDIPNPQQFLVHVHPSPDELGSVYRPDLPIAASAQAFADALGTLQPPARIAWSEHRASLRAACEAYLTPVALPGAVKLAEVIRMTSEILPEDAIVTNGAGNYAAFLHRYFEYKSYRTQLAPTSGSMGYGLPAAIAAQLAHPDRPVVNFQGDGCFLMTGQELATAVQYCAAHHHRDPQQRHVRHHPHAPGARVSEPRGRHHARQSGLRRLRAQLRRRRLHHRGDRRLCARAASRAEGAASRPSSS